MSGDADFPGLGRRVLETLLANPGEFSRPVPTRLVSPPRIRDDLPEFVLDSEAGLLPGEPPCRSLSLALPVGRTGTDGLTWTFGHKLMAFPGSQRQRDFLQILLIECYEPVDRPLISRLASLRSLTGMIPGYMAHSVAQETSARVHRDLVSGGFVPEHLAAAHLAQARSRGHAGGVFVAVGVPSRAALELLSPYVEETQRMIAGLSVRADAGDGAVDGCNGRRCADCDEKDVCDRVRAVLKAHVRGTSARG